MAKKRQEIAERGDGERAEIDNLDWGYFKYLLINF